MHETVSFHTRVHAQTLQSELLWEVLPESDSNDSVWRLTPAGTPLHGEQRAAFEKYLLVKLGNNGATPHVIIKSLPKPRWDAASEERSTLQPWQEEGDLFFCSAHTGFPPYYSNTG